MELFCGGLIRMCLDAQSLLDGQDFEQEGKITPGRFWKALRDGFANEGWIFFQCLCERRARWECRRGGWMSAHPQLAYVQNPVLQQMECVAHFSVRLVFLQLETRMRGGGGELRNLGCGPDLSPVVLLRRGNNLEHGMRHRCMQMVGLKTEVKRRDMAG